MSPTEFEFLINFIGEKISKKDTAFRKAISVQESLAPTHSSTDLFIYFPSSSTASCFLFVKMYWVFWVPNYFFSFAKFDKFYDTFLSPLHFTISQLPKRSHTAQHYRLTPLFKTEASGMETRWEERSVVTCHMARPDLLRP